MALSSVHLEDLEMHKPLWLSLGLLKSLGSFPYSSQLESQPAAYSDIPRSDNSVMLVEKHLENVIGLTYEMDLQGLFCDLKALQNLQTWKHLALSLSWTVQM